MLDRKSCSYSCDDLLSSANKNKWLAIRHGNKENIC